MSSNRGDWVPAVAVLMAVALLIAACIAGAVVSSRYELERAKIIQQEKSERGHWLWGHATDRLKERAK